jgi:hypothetical protein
MREITADGSTPEPRILPGEVIETAQINVRRDFAATAFLRYRQSIVFGPWSGGDSHGIKVLDLNTNQVHPLPGASEMWSPRISFGRISSVSGVNEWSREQAQ